MRRRGAWRSAVTWTSRGSGEVTRVEVGVDGDWRDATLEPPVGEFAWRGWSFAWTATSGDHELSCRATDTAGHTQPLEQPWNYQGMGNNLVHTVAVTARRP
jgi:sulfane dehydrogenase subunit SoxC